LIKAKDLLIELIAVQHCQLHCQIGGEYVILRQMPVIGRRKPNNDPLKRILLLSDTHGHMDETILKYVSQADEVWHAGDIGDLYVTDTVQKLKPLRAVYGNIDNDKARMEFPLNNRFTCEGVDVWITHIGGYPGKYNPAIRNEIMLNPPKLFICGHSHILKVMFDKKLDLLHMNPGACGISGFHQVRTMLRFVIDGAKISDLEIIEIGKK
jgi:uncharacterized protein